MGRLDNKICIITAAAQGIGLATVELFKKEGAIVYALDINAEKLSTLKDVNTVVLDVTDKKAMKAFLESLERVDVLFNCAGFVHSGDILTTSDEDWDFSYNLNVKSMFQLTKLVLPKMLSSQSGSIINMSSVASSIKGVPNRFVYSTSKAAVIGLTKSIASDFVTQGIRCNAICPGTVDSPSLHQRLEETGDYQKAWDEFVSRQPMGRVGDPKEIAELALYLASDSSQFTTGQLHIIDGGWSN